ncbi:PAS domain S-box protein [Pedobacter cryophilus]|nr:PAS domain S-box protein [Pedobacter cryophilus]
MQSRLTSTEGFPLKQLDLDAILKASLAISEQLLPGKLSEILMQIAMQASGADKGYLLLELENQLSITAEAVVNKGIEIKTYAKLKGPDNSFLPNNIIEYVKKTNEKVVIDDVSKDKMFGLDKYILTAHPKSIACIPILKEKKMIGIIYLENSLFTGVFTAEKVVALKILATQAAVSYENMILFNNLDISKKRFQDIMDNTTAVIFAKFLNGKYLFINKEFEKLYKVSREKVINLTDYEIFPKEFAESFIAKDKLIAKTEKPLTYEENIPHDDGLHTYIIVKFPLRDAEGKIYAIGGIATDITDLKRLKESLQENQSRFNYVLAATQDSIYDWNLETGRIWRNEQFEKLFGGPTGPDLEWWNKNIHPDEVAGVNAMRESVFSRYDQLWNQEYRFNTLNKGYANVIDRGFIIYNPQRQPIRMIGALMDVTERRKEEEEEKYRIVTIIERQTGLLRLNNLINSLPIKEKLKKIIETDSKSIKVERVSIKMFDTDRISLTSENTYLLSKSDYGLGVSIARTDYPRYFSELEFDHIIDANNAEDDPRTAELTKDYLKHYGITSIMNIPVKFKGKIVGIVCHEHVGPKRIWTYEEQAFATSIAGIVSLSLEIEEREKTEEDLKKLNEVLEERIKARTAELSSSEEKFHAIVESANDSIISADKEGEIIYWNTAAEKMFGYSLDEAIGKPISLIIPQQYLEKDKVGFDHFLKTKEARIIGKGDIEMSGLKKGGIEFPIELSVETWKSNNEDFFTAIIEDITETKKAKEKLKEYQHFFNNSYDLSCIANVQGYFEILNPNFEKVLGYSEKELLEKQFFNFVHPDDLDSTLQEIEKLKSGAVTVNFMNRFRKKDGGYLWLDWNSTPDPATGKIYAIARNITEQKIIEIALKQKSEETKQGNIFLDSILENIPNMIFVKDAKELRFVRLNKAGEELLGYKKEDLIGKNDYDLFPKEQADFFTAKDKDVINKGGILDIPEEVLETKTGKHWLHTRKITIKDESGNPLYLLGISWDITEQKKVRSAQ